MNDTYGIEDFWGPLFNWLIVAIVVEIVVFRKSRETNPWLPASFFVVTMFRLYWSAWINTLQLRVNETAREKMLISIFVFFATAVFLPAMAMMFHHVWSRREKCGMVHTVIRLIPSAGVTYLFLSHFIMATRFILTFPRF